MPMITVPLGERTYPIYIGSGMLDCLGAHVLESPGAHLATSGAP